jgi:F-type H+-transporting ATPase subunit b
MLVAGLGLVFHVAERPVKAQTTETASAPETQAADQNKPEQDESDEYMKSPNVVALGAKLGLNPDQSKLAFELTNFLLLAVAVAWGIAKFLPKTLRSRTEAIQKNLVDARTATEEAKTRLSSVEERLSKLDGEIAAMKAHAEQDAAKEEVRLKAAVEDEKQKILASAEQEIAAATMHAQKLLQQHAAELAIEQAARKLVVSAETDRLLVQGFAQRLAGDESKKGQN